MPTVSFFPHLPPNMEANSFVGSAIWYLNQGFSVIPVMKNKKPYFEWREFQTRKATEEEIREWWKNHPEANVAIVTGEISGVTVVDWDCNNKDGTTNPQPNWDFETPTAKTGGGGMHFFFQYNKAAGQTARFAQGCDIRNDGGYVLVAPSVNEKGAYKWEPGKAITQVEPIPIPAELMKLIEKERTKEEDKQRNFRKLLNETITTGSRNDRAVRQCRSFMRYIDKELWDQDVYSWLSVWNKEKCSPPLPEDELKLVYESTRKMALADEKKERKEKEEEIERINQKEIDIQQIGDEYTVRAIGNDGVLTFKFEEFLCTADVMESVLYLSFEKAGRRKRELTRRINILSASAQDALCLKMKKIFNEDGEKFVWDEIVNTVFTDLAKMITEDDGMLPFDTEEEHDSEPILTPLLEDKAINIFFGYGGLGKTTLALRMGLAVASGKDFLGYEVGQKGGVLFLDYEDRFKVFKARINALAAQGNHITEEDKRRVFYYPSRGIPLYEMVKPLKRRILENDIRLIIIDSAGGACGGPPESAEVALRLCTALNKLDVGVLLIAHRTKDETAKKPFGSVFWENAARNCWLVEGEPDDDTPEKHLGLIHTKCNYSRKSRPIGIKMEYVGNAIKIYKEDNEAVFAHASTKEKILNALKGNPLSVKELEDEISIPYRAIQSSLKRLKDKGTIEYVSGKYKLVFAEDPSWKAAGEVFGL